MGRAGGFVFLLFLCAGCGKARNQVPDVPVNFVSLLTDPGLLALNTPGGAVSINGYGVSGIIIYHTITNGYVAYDRCSTVNPEERCAVVLDNPTYTATDPCSGAKFSLEDGSPAKAPAVIALRQYYVYISGNSLRVTN